MGEMEHIQSGMSVYRADGLEIGKVKEHWGETFYVGNHSISVEMVDQVLDQCVYLKGNYTGFAPVGDSFDEDVIRVAARGEGAVAARDATFAAKEREER